MKDESEHPGRCENAEEAEAVAENISAILRELLAAGDVAKLKAFKGDFTKEKASKLSHAIAVAVDGMVLTALRDKGLAEKIVSILLDRMKKGRGNSLP